MPSWVWPVVDDGGRITGQDGRIPALVREHRCTACEWRYVEGWALVDLVRTSQAQACSDYYLASHRL